MGQRRGFSGAVAAVLAMVLGSTLVTVGSPSPSSTASTVPDAASAVIARYRQRIPELMDEQEVPGLAVALVDAHGPLWVQGFGHLDGPDSAPVTADTIFSVQSMSKLFTATAVMRAVSAGRLDLDVPITTYLPDFTVHSAFEVHPERKITLRMLLSHTAGFAHEAPVGNNNELAPGTFDAHVRSISDTWLRFPAGTGYAYSNLGIDLAGYILERIDGTPFAKLMQDSLLGPLGMDHSTFDRTRIRATHDRAVGHADPFPHPPLYEPMTAAGGLYSSAADLARFLALQLDNGSVDGRVVLLPRWLKVQRTVPAPHAGAPAGYALGVARHEWNRFDQRPNLFDHGGGGYGFLSDLWWAPQLGVGIAILTNSQDHHLQGNLALSILGDLVTEPGTYHDRLLALPPRPPVLDPASPFEPPFGMTSLVADTAMAATGDEAIRWATYGGRYRAPAWGVLDPIHAPDRFVVEGGVPYFHAEDDDHSLVRHRLTEVTPGLFLAEDGEMLDLRGQVPTWGNVRLVRVAGGPAAGEWALLAAVAVLSVTWLSLGAARIRRSRRAGPTSLPERVAAPRWQRVAGAVATLTAVLAVGSVVLIIVAPGLVDSGFLGWLELPLVVRVVLHIRLALAVLSGCSMALVTAGWVGHWWSRSVLLQYAALAVTAIALDGQLAAWRLIGWGMT